MAYQSKTYSLSDEVIAWLGTLKDDYGSVNKGLLAMIAGQGNGVANNSTIATTDAIGDTEHIDNRPKNAYCKHCGSRFAGAKFATICSECKSSGHTLTPAECPVCNEARAI